MVFQPVFMTLSEIDSFLDPMNPTHGFATEKWHESPTRVVANPDEEPDCLYQRLAHANAYQQHGSLPGIDTQSLVTMSTTTVLNLISIGINIQRNKRSAQKWCGTILCTMLIVILTSIPNSRPGQLMLLVLISPNLIPLSFASTPQNCLGSSFVPLRPSTMKMMTAPGLKSDAPNSAPSKRNHMVLSNRLSSPIPSIHVSVMPSNPALQQI